jgi:glycosyltransferase involved in cell wall biosynthesis
VALAARVVTVSSYSRQDISSFLQCDAGRMEAIANGVDPIFRPAAPQDVATACHRLRIARPYVLFVGGFDFRKNLRRLMAAFAQLVDEGFPHQLVLVGGRGNDPRLYPDPNEAVLAYQLGHRVSILDGGVDDGTLRALYTGADLFVFPSLFEGFGLPPLEAMACGTPVVCSRAASLPEVVGGAAVLFEPDEPGSIAAAMRGILCDPEAGGRLVDAGPAHAQSFSWDAAVRTLHAALMACC